MIPYSRPRAVDEPVRRIEVGSVAIFPLVQLHYRVDPARFFPQIADAPLEPDTWYTRSPYVEDGALVIEMGGFLIRTRQSTILVDAGVGNDKTRPNPNFDHRSDDWLALLAKAGASPEDIDTVLFTHLHVDHVGFATSLVDGRWVPTFPRARYHTTADELGYWTSPTAAPELARLGDYIEDSVSPLQDAGVLQLSAPDTQIDDSVRLLPAAGHTPGNVCIDVRSEGRRAVFAGDMVHHALQLARPSWSTDYCIDEEAAAQQRIHLLSGLADDDLLFAAHFPMSVPGRVRPASTGEGYAFSPVYGEPVG